ncbi:tripartite-type tricarboxylate transporter receptor subunit TctC [Advenella incenata]|uniref:Tripartite-type tricarboxylate transporter receptor subunit TctC n=1 Tax=Advenella incenata TaxID=267800 RepID=A0A4Q7V8H8_9BURK|nr:tripartite-type tricarboxylate transporter receptor subunit TctC [Advenella incenata]
MSISTLSPRRISACNRFARKPLLTLFFLLSALAFSCAWAQSTWPDKPVRLIVPYPVGGSTDVLARMMADYFSNTLGQPFIVENRAGANGNIGAAFVAKAAADGYTLLLSTTGPLSLNKLVYTNTPFDPVRDFAPILLVAQAPLVLVAHPSVPIATMDQFIATVMHAPGKYTYATAGKGSMGHMAGEMIQVQTGTKILHVPYKGSTPAMNDLIAGVVDFSIDLVPTYLTQIQSGKARAIASLGETRDPSLPDTPTLREAGIPTSATGWIGLAGPAGLPAGIIDTLNGQGNKFLNSQDARSRLDKIGLRPLGGDAAQFGQFILAELAKWQTVARNLSSTINK